MAHGFEAGAFASLTVFAGWLGGVEVAAYGIVLNLFALPFMPALGLSTAANVRVGQAVGRGDREGAREAAWAAFRIIVVLQLAIGLGYAVFAGFLAGLYTGEAAVLAVAIPAVRVAGLALLPDALQVVLVGCLRGLSDVWPATGLLMVAFWVTMVPAAWWLGVHLGLGASGLVASVGIGCIAAVALLALRFRRVVARTRLSSEPKPPRISGPCSRYDPLIRANAGQRPDRNPPRPGKPAGRPGSRSPVREDPHVPPSPSPGLRTRSESEMNGEPPRDAVSGAGPEAEGVKEPPSRRLRGWRRNVLLALGGILVVLIAAAGWFALDPSILRSAAEHVASAATGRPVAIGTLGLRVVQGHPVIEVTGVRIGKTTIEHGSVSLAGMRSHAQGEGVRFPNGSSLDRFRASIDLSLTGRPRVSTVEAAGAVLVTARRTRSDPNGSPPPFARLLIVPRILLGLGLERLVLHSGTLEVRGRSSTHSAGISAVMATTGHGLDVHGDLLIAPDRPPLPFEGTVRDPLTDDWRIDLRLTGDRVPMESVRFLTGVMEPNPTVQEMLHRLSGAARFVLTARLARARIDHATLDFTFGAPEEPDEAGIRLDGVRFLARASPDPGGWTVTGEVDWSRLTEGRNRERSPYTVRWSTGAPGSLQWSARRGPISILARVTRNALPPGDSLRSTLERLQLAGTIEELAAFGDPGASGEPSFWLSAVVSGFGARAGDWQVSDAGARIEFAEGRWRARFAGERFNAGMPSFRSAPYELTLEGEVQVADGESGWTARTGGLRFAMAGLAGRIEGGLAIPRADPEAAPSLDAEIRLDDVALTDIGDLLPDHRAVAFTRWYRRAVHSGRLTDSTVTIRGDPRGIPFPGGGGLFRAQGRVREVDFAYAEGWPAVRIERAEVRADGAALELSAIRASIFDTLIEDGFARLPDSTDPKGRVQVSLAGSGPAGDLLAFVRASPMRTKDGGPAPDLHADGPASTAAELDIPYGRGATQPANRRFGKDRARRRGGRARRPPGGPRGDPGRARLRCREPHRGSPVRTLPRRSD